MRLGVLDGLRGVAIAVVVWYHLWQIAWLDPSVRLGPVSLGANPVVQTGFLGVDLFFFLSGACLFLPYARAYARGEPGLGLRDYASRRAAKIVPSYLLALAVFTVAGRATLGSPSAIATEVGRHLLFVHTWFDGSYGSIDGVLWSLAIEVQFYVIFPALAALARRAPLPTFAGMAIVAVIYRARVTTSFDAVHLVSQLPGVLDLYAAGMLVAWLVVREEAAARDSARRRAAWTLLSLAGVAGCSLAIWSAFGARLAPDWPEQWLGTGRLAVAVALAALAAGAVLGASGWARAIANPVLVALAIVSYNLYLWHAFVAHAIVGARWFGSEPDLQRSAATGLRYELVAFGCALAVAAALTYGLERPVLRRLRGAPGRPVVAPPPLARVGEGLGLGIEAS